MKLQQILRRYLRRQFPQASPKWSYGSNAKTFGYVTFNPNTNSLDVDAENLYAVEVLGVQRGCIDWSHPDVVEEVDILCDKVEDYLMKFLRGFATDQILSNINIGCITIARSITPELDEIRRERRERKRAEIMKSIYGGALN